MVIVGIKIEIYIGFPVLWKVEGAANQDGRKPSIWDTFSHAGNGIVLCLHIQSILIFNKEFFILLFIQIKIEYVK